MAQLVQSLSLLVTATVAVTDAVQPHCCYVRCFVDCTLQHATACAQVSLQAILHETQPVVLYNQYEEAVL
jgi:hypothetical protein